MNKVEHLVLINTHGQDKQGLTDTLVQEAITKLTSTIEERGDKLAIGFDGDGAYGDQWPLPSSVAVRLVDAFSTRKRQPLLIQSQVTAYAATPSAYSQAVPGFKIQREFDEDNFKTIAYGPTAEEDLPNHVDAYTQVRHGAFTKNKSYYGGTLDEDVTTLVGSTAAWENIICRDGKFPALKKVTFLVIWSTDIAVYSAATITKRTLNAVKTGNFLACLPANIVEFVRGTNVSNTIVLPTTTTVNTNNISLLCKDLFDENTVPDLINIAREMKISLKGNTRKRDICTLLANKM